MKVLQVIHGFLPQFRGGTELYLLGLARRLRDLGHDVEIVTGTTHTADEPHADTYSHDGFKVHKIVLSGTYMEHWTRSLSPAATRLFAGVVASVAPDIVHVQHWYRLSRNLVETCRRLGVPAVCTLHDLWTSCPRIFRIRDESFCERPLGAESCTSCVPRFPWMDDESTAAEVELFRDDFVNELTLARRIVVPSKAHGALVRRMLDVPAERFTVLPHGTITEVVPPRAPEPDRSRGAKGKIRLGVWGHLFHMKGVHLLLEALQTLRRSDRFGVHVWGKVVEPRYKKRLEAAAEGLDVTWHGAFTPEDLGAVRLDAAVIPSFCSESFSFVLDEAFRLGLPAIVSDRGALAERVGDAGTTFEAESSDDLARVLIDLLRHPRRLHQWATAIPELTTMEWHAREMAHVYSEVVREDLRDSTPDASLPFRRFEHLAELNARREALMFGYLGHIKRETGRADHYENATKEAIARQHEIGADVAEVREELERVRGECAEATARADAARSEAERFRGDAERIRGEAVRARGAADGERKTLERVADERSLLVGVLADEVVTLRDALARLSEGSPRVRRSAPDVPDLVEHVPSLGSAADVVETNQSILESAGRAIGDRGQLIDLLAAEVLAFRRLLAEGLDDASRWTRERPCLPETSDDLPQLGTAADIVADDDDAMSGFLKRIERERAFFRTELGALRRALDGLNEAVGDDLPAPEDPDPTVDSQLAADQSAVVRFFERLEVVRGRLDQLETKARMVEILGQMIEHLRSSFTQIFAEEPTIVAEEIAFESPDDHVPNLGDLATVQEVNFRLMRDGLAEVVALKEALASHAADPEAGE